MEIFEKLEPIEYVKLNGKEFKARSVISALCDMLDTSEDDRYGDYSLRDYELSSDIEIYDTLAEMGLVKHWIGSREARLYCRAAGATEKLKAMLNELYDSIDE